MSGAAGGAKRWRSVLRGAFGLLAVGFLASFAWRSRATLAQVAATADPLLLGAAVALWALLHAVAPLFSVLMLRGFGRRLGYREAFAIHAGRLPAKYLPGGIWHSVARAGDYHRAGLESRLVVAYLLIENVTSACGTLALGGVTVAALPAVPVPTRALALAIAVSALAALALLPPLLGRFALPAGERLAWRGYGKGLVCLAGYLVLLGAAFSVFLKGLSAAPAALSPIATGGIYLFAWGVGFVALFAPQGIGVSELVAGHLLGGAMGLAAWMALLAGFRGVALLGDLAAWLVSLALKGTGRPAAGDDSALASP